MNSNVDICTSDSKLVIKYGSYPISDDEPSEMALASFKYICTDMNDIRSRYIKLGFHLSEVEHLQFYRHFGFDNVYDFAFENFGLDKTTVSRCISVSREFSSGTGTSSSLFLDDKYSEYSYSQLVEMINLSDDERRKIKPDMSVRQIRELKKSFKNSSSCFDNLSVSDIDKILRDSVVKYFNRLKVSCEDDHRRFTEPYVRFYVSSLMDRYNSFVCDDFRYKSRPGHITFYKCPEISISKLFDIARDNHISFLESYDYMVFPSLIGSFNSDIFINDLLKTVSFYILRVSFNSYKRIRNLSVSGKRLTWKCEGNTYVVQFSVIKDKDK